MTDMIRGIIVTNPQKVFDAYVHLTQCRDIEVFRIKEKLNELQTVTVNFVFKDMIIGEVQLRIEEMPSYYTANRFLYELERSRTKFELIDSLNNKAAYMSKHNQLIDSGSTRPIYKQAPFLGQTK